MSTRSENKFLASPQSILWQFYASLDRQVRNTIKTEDVSERRQNVAVCIILATTLVEAFLNRFFRVVVSEQGFTQFVEQVMEDLNRRAPLEYKIKEWPKLVFGKSIDFGKGVGQDFVTLKDTRNWLMHFTNTWETIAFDNITIRGLADISRYERLDGADAARALETSEGIIAEIIRLRGVPQENIPYHLQSWLGRVPY